MAAHPDGHLHDARLHDFTLKLSRIEDENDEAVVPYRDRDDLLEDDTTLDLPMLTGGQ
jgi:hypothetical protein